MFIFHLFSVDRNSRKNSEVLLFLFDACKSDFKALKLSVHGISFEMLAIITFSKRLHYIRKNTGKLSDI